MKDLEEKIETQVPNEKDKRTFIDLETELVLQITKAYKGKRFMEAYFITWTVIEQFMLPKLIRFVSSSLKITLPPNIAELQVSQVIRLYYFLSHDEELYSALEVARKRRNKLVHQVYKQKDWTEIKKEYRVGLKQDLSKLLSLLRDRFSGKTKIPVLTLYSSGWNDFRKEAIKVLQGQIDEIKKGA